MFEMCGKKLFLLTVDFKDDRIICVIIKSMLMLGGNNMNAFKKISALVISLAMIMSCAFSTVSFAAVTFNDVTEENQYATAIFELVEKGVINGYNNEDGTSSFKPDGEITRAEFAKIIAVASAPKGYVFGATVPSFTDVPTGNWAIPYIEYAVSSKIVNGMGDGKFAPNASVTYGQAIKMVVCALGYGNVITAAPAGTPWYQPYIEMANKLNITSNAFGLPDNNAARGLVAQLVYNMTNTKPLVQTGVDQSGNPVYSQGADKFDNTEEASGQLVAVYDNTLNGVTVKTKEILVMDGNDELKFTMGKYDAAELEELLGYEVNIKYTEDDSGKNEIQSIKKASSNEEYIISDVDIEEITKTYVKYYNEDDEIKKIKINDDMYVLKNGGAIDMDDLIEELEINCGEIRFIDSDGNGVMDVAFIHDYETYFVSGAPTEDDGEYTIYDKFDSTKKLVLDEDTQQITVKLVTNSSKNLTDGTLDSISASSVLSVAVSASDSDVIEIIVSKKTASGSTSTSKVEAIGSDYIKFGTTSVSSSKYYEDIENLESQMLSVGDVCTAYLDFTGKLVAVSKKEATTLYGYITKVATDSSSSMDEEEYFVNMYTSSGQLSKKLPVATRGFKINDHSADGSDLKKAIEDSASLVNGDKDESKIINAEQAVLVKYELSGNQLKSVYIVGEPEDGETKSEGITPKYISEDDEALTFSSSSNSFKKGSTSKFTISSSTKVISVPLDRNQTGYKVATGTSFFTDGLKYMIDAFDADGNSPAKVVVVYGVTSMIKPSSDIVLVKELNPEYNADEEEVEKLVYYKPGSSQEYEVLGAEGDTFAGVKAGDVIRILVTNDEVERVHHLFSANNKELVTDNKTNDEDNMVYSETSGVLSQTVAGNVFKAIYGTVTLKPIDSEGESIGVIRISSTSDSDKDAAQYTMSSSVKIMKYNKDSDALYTFGVGENDIRDINSNTAASKVFITLYNNTLKNIIIFE